MGFVKHHVKSVHEGHKFQCPHCEQKSAHKSNLQQHIKSIHEGQNFLCPQCEYKATQKGNLQVHIKSVHEGQKFQCAHCEYRATQKGNLQRHIISVHEGQMFPCPWRCFGCFEDQHLFSCPTCFSSGFFFFTFTKKVSSLFKDNFSFSANPRDNIRDGHRE